MLTGSWQNFQIAGSHSNSDRHHISIGEVLLTCKRMYVHVHVNVIQNMHVHVHVQVVEKIMTSQYKCDHEHATGQYQFTWEGFAMKFETEACHRHSVLIMRSWTPSISVYKLVLLTTFGNYRLIGWYCETRSRESVLALEAWHRFHGQSILEHDTN